MDNSSERLPFAQRKRWPAADDPLNRELAELFRRDREEFFQRLFNVDILYGIMRHIKGKTFGSLSKEQLYDFAGEVMRRVGRKLMESDALLPEPPLEFVRRRLVEFMKEMDRN